jgi:hypothetical protein
MEEYITKTARWVRAYQKTKKVIMSCKTSQQLEGALRMVENYERFMLNFGPTSVKGKQLTAGTVNDLLSLTKLKRRQIER